MSNEMESPDSSTGGAPLIDVIQVPGASAPQGGEPHGPEVTRRAVVQRGARVAIFAGGAAALGGFLAACGSAVKKATGGGKRKPKPTATTTTPATTTPATTTTPAAAAPEVIGAPKPQGPAITLNVNGEEVTVYAKGETPLLYVLRDEVGLRGPKFGCGLMECGACAVLLEDEQIRSCVTSVESVVGKKIVTLDGLAESYEGPGKVEGMHPLQAAWIEEQVPQCGYCQNGMIIQAASLLAENPTPTTAQIKENMNGHLCRCGTYNGIVRAVERAAKEMAA